MTYPKLFRKKPVEIQAMHFDGTRESAELVSRWVAEHGGLAYYTHVDCGDYWGLYIDTLEGQMQASPGDWVIRGVQGEHYPCKPGVFEQTYEEVA